MALAVTEAELRELLAETPFTRAFGFRVFSIGEGTCTLEVPFQGVFERPGGIVSGQVFMTAADVAMWLAIMTRFGKADMSVTAEMTTAFLSAARQEDFRCTASVLKWGRRLIYGVAECVNGGGKLLTHHTITYSRPDESQPAAARRARDG